MIQVELSPEVEAMLNDRAQASGVATESYARSILEKAVATSPLPPSRPMSEADMERFLKAMAANSDKIPELPDEAFTRESFYQDHD